jgi:hypothetical protein
MLKIQIAYNKKASEFSGFFIINWNLYKDDDILFVIIYEYWRKKYG